MSKYPRGSEWRKWDLHFHTPSSYDYKDKSVTNEQLIEKIIENGIEVVAITDHHVIDVERVENLQQLGSEKGITVLPGIEILSDARGSEPIHFIGIFPEESDLSFIWAQLSNRTNMSKISQGSKESEVYCKLEETATLIRELGGIVTIHAGSKTNTIDTISNALPHAVAQKMDIAELVDIFEMGKESDADGYEKYVFKALGKRKPMIICSDNHDIKNYNLKQNCWIKADPTFAGLKQVIYEPDRVKIQGQKPEFKNSYQTIECIEFFDDSDIPDMRIPFNPNLNAIIGGRSSGKSVLLGCIAKNVDLSESLKKSEEYDAFVGHKISHSKLNWNDGLDDVEREIEFFPQSYINSLAAEETERDNLIESIVKGEPSNKKLIEEYRNFTREQKTNIVNKINEFVKIESQIEIKEKELKGVGDKKVIAEEINRLDKQLKEELEKQAFPIDELDEKFYKYSEDSIRTKNAEISGKSGEIEIINSLKNHQIINNIPSEIVGLSEETSSDFYTKISNFSKKVEQEWDSLISDFYDELSKESVTLKKELEDLQQNKKYLECCEYYKQNAGLNLLRDILEKEKEKLILVEKEEVAVGVLKSNLDEIKDSILAGFFKYFSKLKVVTGELNTNTNDLKIIPTIRFDKRKFESIIENNLNLRGIKNQEIRDYAFGEENFEAFFTDLFQNTVRNEISFKGGKNTQQFLIELFSEKLFELSFDVEYQGDILSQMSEGKRAFVVLRLLLDFSDKKCPILIDQPEDDLDNRAIYNELVKYLRIKKESRQIFVVTHNPNIVVGADAEEIIVANQHGVGNENEGNSKFSYISGSLENSAEFNDAQYILQSKGIKQHICDILEGGEMAFKKREEKYSIDS